MASWQGKLKKKPKQSGTFKLCSPLHSFITYVVLPLRYNVQVSEDTRIKLFSLEIRSCYNTFDERWDEDDQYNVTV